MSFLHRVLACCTYVYSKKNSKILTYTCVYMQVFKSLCTTEAKLSMVLIYLIKTM